MLLNKSLKKGNNMLIYSIVVTVLALLLAGILFFKKSGKTIKALQVERQNALNQVNANLQTIEALEKRNKRIQDEAKKIQTSTDVANFLKSFSNK
jgi:sensor domain CHASE-containing protein